MRPRGSAAGKCTRAGQQAQCGAECVRRHRAGQSTSWPLIGRPALRGQGHAANAGPSAERRACRSGRTRDRREQQSAGPAGRGRRGPHRVHSNDRVGLRAFRLQCLAWPSQESVEPGHVSRRFVVWIGGRRCKRRGRRRARFGHRRLASHSGALLRYHSLEADLWRDLDEGRNAARAVTRHHWSSGAQRGRSAAACCDPGRSAGIAPVPRHCCVGRCGCTMRARHRKKPA